jgi:O-antigen/teichoic acid export membrane protein
VLLAAGGVFTLSGLCQALAVQSDQILIAKVLGLAHVAPYSVVQRLFSQPQIFVALLVAAQWPAYGEAMGRGDGAWIRQHFLRSLYFITAFALFCACFMSYFCSEILELWVGHVVRAEPILVVGMAIYCIVACVANAIIAFFLALGLHRRVITLQISMFAVNLPISLFLLPRVGVAGAVYGTAAGYIFAILVPGLTCLPSTFRAFPRLHENEQAARKSRLDDQLSRLL